MRGSLSTQKKKNFWTLKNWSSVENTGGRLEQNFGKTGLEERRHERHSPLHFARPIVLSELYLPRTSLEWSPLELLPANVFPL